jgi:hypothetical protein
VATVARRENDSCARIVRGDHQRPANISIDEVKLFDDLTGHVRQESRRNIRRPGCATVSRRGELSAVDDPAEATTSEGRGKTSALTNEREG